MYCLKCKKETKDVNPEKVTTANARERMTAKCAVCSSSKSKFVSGGDIVNWLNKAGKEFHIPGYNFCGPGTKLKQRLDSNDNAITKPVNAIDRACMTHDIAYRDNKDLKRRHKADAKLINDLNDIDGLSWTEKFTRGLIKTALKGKMALGMGQNKKC